MEFCTFIVALFAFLTAQGHDLDAPDISAELAATAAAAMRLVDNTVSRLWLAERAVNEELFALNHVGTCDVPLDMVQEAVAIVVEGEKILDPNLKNAFFYSMVMKPCGFTIAPAVCAGISIGSKMRYTNPLCEPKTHDDFVIDVPDVIGGIGPPGFIAIPTPTPGPQPE